MLTVPTRPAGFRLALIALASLAIPLEAQQLSVVRAGSFEVGPFLGASYGIDETRVMGGGNVTFAINKYILPYAEYSYFPGIGRNVSTSVNGTGVTATEHYAIPLSDFHGGVHIRLPIRESRFVPYGVFGVGGLTHGEKTITANLTTNGIAQQLSVTIPGATDFAVNFGGGLRYYVTSRYGFRMEAKAYKPTGAYSQVFGKAEFGFFIQLR